MRLALELPPWQIKQILKYSNQGVFITSKKTTLYSKNKRVSAPVRKTKF